MNCKWQNHSSIGINCLQSIINIQVTYSNDEPGKTVRLYNMFAICVYCAFHKHANSKVQKPPSQLRFSLPSIIITITSNEPWNTETHKTDRNPPITNHKPWPFEPVKVKFCFLRGPFRWLTAAKNAIVSWLLNFRIRMFVKSAVNLFQFCPSMPSFVCALFHVNHL